MRTRLIKWASWVVMGLGAVVSVKWHLNEKLASPSMSWSTGTDSTTLVSNYELLLFAALGAAPGFLAWALAERLLGGQGGAPASAQPRCGECGEVLAHQGARCSNCSLPPE